MSRVAILRLITALMTVATAAPTLASDISSDRREREILRRATQVTGTMPENAPAPSSSCRCGRSYSAADGSGEPGRHDGRPDATTRPANPNDIDFGETAHWPID